MKTEKLKNTKRPGTGNKKCCGGSSCSNKRNTKKNTSESSRTVTRTFGDRLLSFYAWIKNTLTNWS